MTRATSLEEKKTEQEIKKTKKVTLQALYIYPVKSLAGIALNTSQILSTGLKHDREWIIVNQENKMLTQRAHPEMSQIKTELNNDHLVLSHKHYGSVSVPINAPITPESRSENTEWKSIEVWKDTCQGRPLTHEINQWLSDVLKQNNISLLHADTHTNAHERAYKNPARFKQHTTHFADAAPFLMANQASLDLLNTTLSKENTAENHLENSHPISMQRFRPNLVIQGINAFEEHAYSTLKNQQHHLELIDACARCSMITLNPNTAQFDKNAYPFKTLAALNAMPDKPKVAAFGVNAIMWEGQEKEIRVGDEFEIA